MGGLIQWAKDLCAAWNLSPFVMYALPDGLWLASYILVADTLIPESPQKNIWVMALPANAIGSEIAQYFHLLPGVFDVWDLACYLIPALLYLAVRKSEIIKQPVQFREKALAPIILVTYLWLAGGSVEQLSIPFVVTCALYSSALILISYIARHTRSAI